MHRAQKRCMHARMQPDPPPAWPALHHVFAEMGTLELLQWYNLTCNDCGGRLSNRCINGTSCSLPESNCTCADTGAAAVAAADTPTEALAAVADAGQAGTCNYANMS